LKSPFVTPDFTGFLWISLDCTGFRWIALDCKKAQDFRGVERIPAILPSGALAQRFLLIFLWLAQDCMLR